MITNTAEIKQELISKLEEYDSLVEKKAHLELELRKIRLKASRIIKVLEPIAHPTVTVKVPNLDVIAPAST